MQSVLALFLSFALVRSFAASSKPISTAWESVASRFGAGEWLCEFGSTRTVARYVIDKILNCNYIGYRQLSGSSFCFFMSTSSRFAVAVHVLTLMAWADEEPLKSDHVAESVNTNPVVIRRMLCELAESKLVVSQTGSMGGSRLARQPEEITLLDIYQAVESRGVFSLHRHPPNPDCPVGVNIGTVLNDVLDEVDSAVESVLANITLKEAVGRLKPCVRSADTKMAGVAGAKSLSAAAAIKRKNGKEHTLSARN
jgi:Rrf2 family protein